MTDMRRSGLRAATLAALLAAAAMTTACGSDEEEAGAARGPALAPAAAIEQDPYAIECGHVRDQMRWARVTRRATVAIADRERIPKLNRLRATQSVFYAMTEVCKGQPASFQPAVAAVDGVRSGTYRVGR